MNAPLRRVGVVVLVLFAMLFVNLNYRQAYKADDYRTSDFNGRVQVTEYERPRGKIINAQGVAVADSKETTDTLKFLRFYPFGEQYAHVLGYKPVNLAATDVEKLQTLFLAGQDDRQVGDRITEMFTGKQAAGGNVMLTLSKAAQEKAFAELTGNQVKAKRGAVIVLKPDTGALLASVSLPTYDPNLLATHDPNAAAAAYNKLNSDPARPLNNRATSENYPPGSTFKVITAAAGMKFTNLNGASVLDGGATYQPPVGQAIKNATGVNCPDKITLKQALTVSCNTAFSRLGVESLGADKLKQMAADFGFDTRLTFVEDKDNIYEVALSQSGEMNGPDGRADPAAVAQSCIGQWNVRMTPLQGAVIAATVANGGQRMRPYLVDKLQNADLSIAATTQPKEANRPIDRAIASDLQNMMIGVVESGTGKKAQIPGYQVGGKTGTAENAEDAADHGWFIGFAMKDGQPIVAAAVFLENAGRGGSSEAARIAGSVMKAYIDEAGK
jgi:penicillin-binding protein A